MSTEAIPARSNQLPDRETNDDVSTWKQEIKEFFVSTRSQLDAVRKSLPSSIPKSGESGGQWGDANVQ